MSFSIASYNALANAYIKPERYPNTPAAVLGAAQRIPALLRHISRLDTDVICLQEVESDMYQAIHTSLEPLGYQSHWLRKGGRKPDGCATFFRYAVVSLRAVDEICFADGRGGRSDSGHVALILLLEQGSHLLGITNTHLKWDPPQTKRDDQWGYRQVTLLLDKHRSVGADCHAWILCGDLNATPDSEVVRTIRRAGMRDAYGDQDPPSTCVPNGAAKKIDYLFHSASLSSRPAELPPLDDQTPLPSIREPSDHLAIRASFEWVKA